MRISDWSSDVCSSDLGAWIGQLFFGLYPCEMCHWQRWPHYAAIALALLAFAVPGRVNQRWLVGLAAVAIALSGAIGVYHAGVEYHWWAGATACTATFSGTGDRSEEHTSELQSLMRISYAVFCLKK